MIRFVLGGAAVLALVLAVATRSSPPVVAATPAGESSSADPVPADREFDATWRDAAAPVALKSASLRSPEPKRFATDRIAPDAPSIVPAVIVATPIETVSAPPRKRHVEHNVCTRHHMRKVYTRGGRSWRCRR